MKRILILMLLLPILLYGGLIFRWIPDVAHMVYNANSQSLPLYANLYSGSKVVDSLKPGMMARLAYASKSGSWIYIYINQRQLALRSNRVRMCYVVPKIGVVDELTLKIFAIACAVFILLLRFTSLNGKRKQPKNTISESMERYAQSRVEAVTRELIQSHNEEKRILISKYENRERLQEEKLQTELIERLMIELNIDRSPTIENMIVSVENLRNIYEEAIQNAKTFGIDLRHVNFEALLKGRLFEICIATLVYKKLGFKILEWTPDKGFDNDIIVQSNLNPDLVLENHAGKNVAIECKYRGTIGKYNSLENAVAWGGVKQSRRYLEFSEKHQIPVYLALGICGDPASPDHIVVPPLDTIINLSEGVDFRTRQERDDGVDKSFTYACAVANLLTWQVSVDRPELSWVH